MKPHHSRWFLRYQPWFRSWLDKRNQDNGWVSKPQARKLMDKALLNCALYKAFAHQQVDDYLKELK